MMWKEISSAPSGKEVLVWDGKKSYIAEWRSVAIYYPGCKPEYGWYLPDSDQDEQGGASEVFPIYWTEIPTPMNVNWESAYAELCSAIDALEFHGQVDGLGRLADVRRKYERQTPPTT